MSADIIPLPPLRRHELPPPSMVAIPLEAFARAGAPAVDELELLRAAQPLTFALMQIEKLTVVKHLLTLTAAQIDQEIARLARDARLLTHAINPLTAGLDRTSDNV